jgi:hypothetical protein
MNSNEIKRNVFGRFIVNYKIGKIILLFGRNKNKKINDCTIYYLNWILEQPATNAYWYKLQIDIKLYLNNI